MSDETTEVLIGTLMPDGTGELVEVPQASIEQLFTTPSALDNLIKRIDQVVSTHKPDLSTAKGRKAIASLAYRVAQTKTLLDNQGKDAVAELKKRPGLVDAGRKSWRDRLDAIRDAARKPLTEWEAAEAARVDKHKTVIARIVGTPALCLNQGSSRIAELLSNLDAVDTSAAALEEFAEEGQREKDKALEQVRKALDLAHQREEAEAELERLRQAEVDRKAEEAREALRREGEERARKALEAEKATPDTQQGGDDPAGEPVATSPQEPSVAPGFDTPAIEVSNPTGAGTGAPLQVSTPAPLPPLAPATQQLAIDIDRRRAANREALEDLKKAVPNVGEKDLKNIIRFIASGGIRHISIEY